MESPRPLLPRRFQRAHGERSGDDDPAPLSPVRSWQRIAPDQGQDSDPIGRSGGLLSKDPASTHRQDPYFFLATAFLLLAAVLACCSFACSSSWVIRVCSGIGRSPKTC